MKPRKGVKPAPAGTPILQEVGYTVSYEDVVVTEAKLDKLKKEQKNAKGMAAYGRHKAWLHYANLRSWQREGHHFRYVSGENAEFCTCGLVLHANGTSDQEIAVVISKSVATKLDVLNLEDIQRVRGHVELPSLQGETVALIIDLLWREDLHDFLWTVICQQCGDHQVDVTNADAKSFVKAHNTICGPAIFGEKGE